jgi:hypothetical protein
MTDDDLIEAMAAAIQREAGAGAPTMRWCRDAAKAALSVARPEIEREALEKAAGVADSENWHSNAADEIAATIRAMKGQS